MNKIKRIVCPHCTVAHLPGSETYFFNENLSIVCKKCSKIIYPAIKEEEIGIPKLADRKYTSRHGQATQWWKSEKDIDFA